MHFKMNRTNGETSKWINSQKNLSLRAGFEEANTFFGTFSGDHKTFGTWKESFLRKEKKIKNEAQQRVMKEVGGSGKQYYTPPVEYMPPLQSFGFVSKNLKCEKCQNKFKTVLSVSAHQGGRKCGVGSQRTCSHFIRLLACILTILYKKYRILTCRNKRESYLVLL